MPNIYPISPHIDLDESQIYNTTALVPRQCFSQLHLHTIFLSRMQNQKYPWTTYAFNVRGDSRTKVIIKSKKMVYVAEAAENLFWRN